MLTNRKREYLTEAEVEKLIAAANANRWGHRDATMILTTYRHGLRASEVCDLEWSAIDFGGAEMHVRRAKNGKPAVHPIRGDELPRPEARHKFRYSTVRERGVTFANELTRRLEPESLQIVPARRVIPKFDSQPIA